MPISRLPAVHIRSAIRGCCHPYPTPTSSSSCSRTSRSLSTRTSTAATSTTTTSTSSSTTTSTAADYASRSPVPPVRLVTFDAYDTLFSIRGSVGHWYREAYIKELESIGLLPSKLTLSALNNETTTAAAVVHNGVVVVPPASAFDKSFRAAYKHMNVLAPCFGAKQPSSISKYGSVSNGDIVSVKDGKAALKLTRSEEWWYDVVSRTILDAIPAEEVPINASDISSTNSGSVTNSKASSEGGAVESEVYREMQARMPRLFARLYRHVFMSREVWSVHPHVHETLRALCVYKDHSSNHNNRPSGRSNSNGYRDRGQWHDVPLQLGIISNSDDRTAPLLEELGLLRYFDFVLTAQEVGSEKPEGLLFHHALSRYHGSSSSSSSGGGISSSSHHEGIDGRHFHSSDAVHNISSLGGACWHVGNSMKHDVEGAVASGWNAVLLNPTDMINKDNISSFSSSLSSPAVGLNRENGEVTVDKSAFVIVKQTLANGSSNRNGVYYEINDFRHLLDVLKLP